MYLRCINFQKRLFSITDTQDNDSGECYDMCILHSDPESTLPEGHNKFIHQQDLQLVLTCKTRVPLNVRICQSFIAYQRTHILYTYVFTYTNIIHIHVYINVCTRANSQDWSLFCRRAAASFGVVNGKCICEYEDLLVIRKYAHYSAKLTSLVHTF